MRRKFFEAMNFDDDAKKIVDFIDELYEVEHEAETIDDLEELRSTKSYRVVKKIDDWMELMDGHYLNSTSLSKAINYYLQRKEGLHYFLKNKYVPIDNNMAERRQRCPVMERIWGCFFIQSSSRVRVMVLMRGLILTKWPIDQ